MAAVPLGGGGAWPDNEPTHRVTHQRPGAAGVEGAGGSGGPGCGARGRRRGLAGLRDDAPSHTSVTRCRRCGGRRRARRAWLRCPWAVAGPGRASRRRAERSSRRGRLAGGPPPTGTPSSPAQQSTRGARNTSGAKATQQQAPQQRPGIQKNRHPDRMSACGGARGIRTPDLLIANETRYQLRHSPKDSNSLAPSQSAVQADHRRVRRVKGQKELVEG